MQREPNTINKQLKMIQKTFDTGMCNRMEEMGFFVRKTKENDKRFRMIELTEKSRCLMQEMCEEMWQMDDKIYSCMTAEERSQLSGLLERILNSLSELE